MIVVLHVIEKLRVIDNRRAIGEIDQDVAPKAIHLNNPDSLLGGRRLIHSLRLT